MSTTSQQSATTTVATFRVALYKNESFTINPITVNLSITTFLENEAGILGIVNEMGQKMTVSEAIELAGLLNKVIDEAEADNA